MYYDHDYCYNHTKFQKIPLHGFGEIASKRPPPPPPPSPQNLTEEEKEVLAEQLAQWKSLRHDLERARMLVELVRKREKLKREQLRLLQRINELSLRPLNAVMRRVMDRLARKDPADIFAEPVPTDDVSGGSYICR